MCIVKLAHRDCDKSHKEQTYIYIWLYFMQKHVLSLFISFPLVRFINSCKFNTYVNASFNNLGIILMKDEQKYNIEIHI